MDYTIFYKTYYDNGNLSEMPMYDIFLSAYDNCDRTKNTFENIKANVKKWFIFPHYGYGDIDDKPSGDIIYTNEHYSESEFFLDFINYFDSGKFAESKICIDTTGFIRPHLIYLLNFLNHKKVVKLDLIYTEPVKYANADETKFSGYIDEIRDVHACSAINNNPCKDKDLLIVCAGYDDNLIEKISQNKKHCPNKYYIVGFPSLQPDMYQENMLKLHKVRESMGESRVLKFAPAFDPFVTAQVISDIIEENPDATNIYLCPLSTKPQTVAMALYYINHSQNMPLSIIFPHSKSYSSQHAVGVKRTWRYTLEL